MALVINAVNNQLPLTDKPLYHAKQFRRTPLLAVLLLFKDQCFKRLPKNERFELYAQLLRAARSSTANIAEGWGRYHYKESIIFFRFARGSIAEILDHSIEARDCNYIELEIFNEIRIQIDTP